MSHIKNIHQTISLHLRYKDFFIQNNKTILFLLCRKFLLIFNKNYNVLNIALSFHFLLQRIKSFLCIELFQISIYVEVVSMLHKTATPAVVLSRVIYKIKKECLISPVNELSIFVLFDNFKRRIGGKKILQKLFKIYKATTLALVYNCLSKRLISLVVNVVYSVIKLNLSRQYPCRSIRSTYINELALFVVCKSSYLKQVINELLYIFRIFLKLMTIHSTHIHVKNDYTHASLKLGQPNIDFKKLVSRFLCMGYLRERALNQNFLLKQASSLIKLKLLLNSLVSYYQNSLHKKYIFIKVVRFLKSAFQNKFKLYEQIPFSFV
jgi:hypothetical protein